MRLLTVEDEIRARVREEERAEGIAIGEKKGRADLLSRLQENGMITADQAATAMGWSF